MKYELTTETKMVGPITLYRIKALESSYPINEGDLGGWIEKESNLSHEGDAWVYGNAEVSGHAKVYGYAQVYDHAQVYGNAQVYGDAWVFGDAQVFGDAWVSGDAWVYGDAWVSGNTRVYGDAPTPNVTESDYVSIGGKKYRLVEVKD